MTQSEGGRVEGGTEAGMDTRRALLCLVAIFLVSLSALTFVYKNFPELEEDEYQYMKLPMDIEDAKNLGRVLSHYKDRYFVEVLVGVFVTYIFLQTFAVPGSIFLSILSGFLFRWELALLLICFCSATGASFCYLLSYLAGRPIVLKYLPDRTKSWQEKVDKQRENLLFYIIFLRITPFLPNWFINITSPIINVPLWPFWLGTFLGDEYDVVMFAEKGQEPRKYPVFSGEGRWKEYLTKTFPAEAENVDKFFKLMKDIQSGSSRAILVKFIPLWAVWLLKVTGLLKFFTNFYEWNGKTCKEVVWGLTDNQELRDIFCYCFGDFGTPPSKSGFPMLTLLHSHFTQGSSYPVGGASEIAFHIIPVIESAGGKVLVRAEVTQIIIDGKGQACGVEVKKGNEPVNVAAPLIISDAGVYNTFERLLPLDVASSSRLWPLVQTAKHACGSMSVFVGINCDAEELDILHKKNAWVFTGNDIDKLTVDYLNLSREEGLDADIPLLFISFPSTKDPEWKKKYPGKTTMAIVTLMPYQWLEEWENGRVMKRGDEYESLKKIFGHKAVEQASNIFPSIKDRIDYINIGTPLSNRYYLGAPRGEIYGLDHTAERFSIWNNAILRPQTDVPGVYLTGQDMCSCGFAGALWGGLLCATSILQRNVKSDLVRLHHTLQDEDKDKAKAKTE